MKQTLCFLSFLTIFLLAKFTFAQTTPPADTAKTTKTTRQIFSQIRGVKLDTNEIIYDENGNALRYYQSQKLVNSGEYIIKTDGPMVNPATKKHLVKVTPEQQAMTFARVKSFVTLSTPYIKEGAPLDISPLTEILGKQALDNKVIMLIFWYSDCPPCTEIFAAINDFLTQIEHRDNIVVLAITPDAENKTNIKLIQKPLKFAEIVNNARGIIQGYGITSFPSFVVADKEHIIRFAIKGLAVGSMPALKNAVKAALQ